MPHLLSCAHGLKQCLPPLLPAPTPLAALRPGTPEHWWTHGPALQGWEDSELQELEPCSTCTGGHSSVTLLAWLTPTITHGACHGYQRALLYWHLFAGNA